MAINKLGINIAQRAASWAKATGKQRILQTKPQIFHGINPEITNPATGETFALPRFISQEMQEARQLNKIAIRQCKTPIDRTFSKAAPEDLKRLTSDTIEDSYSRTVWTNPKDGQVYHLLRMGKTEDGKITMRILDKDGAFVKEAQVQPRQHLIIDDSTPGEVFSKFDPNWKYQELYNLSHAEYMKIGAQRTNPFEEVLLYDCAGKCSNGKYNSELKELEIFRDVIKQLNSGKGNGVISRSRGACGIGYDLFGKDGRRLLTGRDHNDTMCNISYNKMVQAANKRGIRVFNAAGNEGPDSLERSLLNSGAEGVGSLAEDGKILKSCGSRNSFWTQHYERGGVPVVFKERGINITGTDGIDIEVKNPLLGKKADISARIDRINAKRHEIEYNFDSVDEKTQEKYERYYRLSANVIKKFINQTWGLTVKDGVYVLPEASFGRAGGTSLATAVRAAKVNLNDMMKDII